MQMYKKKGYVFNFPPLWGGQEGPLHHPLIRKTEIPRIGDDNVVKNWDLQKCSRFLNFPREGNVRIAGDRKSTRLNSSHSDRSRMPSSA